MVAILILLTCLQPWSKWLLPPHDVHLILFWARDDDGDLNLDGPAPWPLLWSSISIWAPLGSFMELILDPPLAMMRPASMVLDGTETSQQTRNKAGGGWWSRSGSTPAWGLRKHLQKAERRDADILFSATPLRPCVDGSRSPPDFGTSESCQWCDCEYLEYLGPEKEGGACSRYDTLRLCQEWSQIWEWMDFCHYSLCKPRVRWLVTPTLMLHTAPPTVLHVSVHDTAVFLIIHFPVCRSVVLGDLWRGVDCWCKELIQTRVFQETVLLHFLLQAEGMKIKGPREWWHSLMFPEMASGWMYHPQPLLRLTQPNVFYFIRFI